jgi:hypothetical protein
VPLASGGVAMPDHFSPSRRRLSGLALAFALLQQWINSEAPPPVHYPPDD